MITYGFQFLELRVSKLGVYGIESMNLSFVIRALGFGASSLGFKAMSFRFGARTCDSELELKFLELGIMFRS